MNKVQSDAIGAVAGLQIWCSDCGPTGTMYFYTVSGLLEESHQSRQPAIT
jgi:hypothetical protein